MEAETRNATLKGVSEEKENGKTVYELESMIDGRTRDVMIDSAGRVYLVEEQLDVDKAPPPVKAALEARGRIVKLEAVTTRGKTHFEGHVRTKTGQTVAIVARHGRQADQEVMRMRARQRSELQDGLRLTRSCAYCWSKMNETPSGSCRSTYQPWLPLMLSEMAMKAGPPRSALTTNG